MKGIIFNLLEMLVEDEEGDALWESLLDEADVSGVYTALGSYADEELIALICGLAAHRDLPDLFLVGGGARACDGRRRQSGAQPARGGAAFCAVLSPSVGDRESLWPQLRPR